MAKQNTTPDNLIRVLQGLQHFCQKAAPSLQNVVSTWHAHQKQTINPCTNPQICSAVKGKPKAGASCAECVKWVKRIESVYFPQPPFIAWKNVNSSILYNNAIEVCNGFALHLPPGQRPTQISDYDTASILKIMLGFGEYHHQNQATKIFKSPYDVVLEVSQSYQYLAIIEYIHRDYNFVDDNRKP